MDVGRLQRKLDEAGYQPGTIDGVLGARTLAALIAYTGNHQHTQLTAELGRACARHLISSQIDTALRIRHALSQWAVETGGYIRMEENLNYSAPRLRAVWPKRFPDDETAYAYAHQPQKLAEKVYGGRLGNNELGDGWRFRGRGPTQLTGRDNYARASALAGIDLVVDPDLVANPYVGIQVACAYWQDRRINEAADRDDLLEVRRRVNGGSIGIEEARHYLDRIARVLQ